jgi:hypothetical protein
VSSAGANETSGMMAECSYFALVSNRLADKGSGYIHYNEHRRTCSASGDSPCHPETAEGTAEDVRCHEGQAESRKDICNKRRIQKHGSLGACFVAYSNFAGKMVHLPGNLRTD